MILKASFQNWFLSRILVAGSMCQIIPVRLVRLLYFQVVISEGVSNIGLFQDDIHEEIQTHKHMNIVVFHTQSLASETEGQRSTCSRNPPPRARNTQQTHAVAKPTTGSSFCAGTPPIKPLVSRKIAIATIHNWWPNASVPFTTPFVVEQSGELQNLSSPLTHHIATFVCAWRPATILLAATLPLLAIQFPIPAIRPRRAIRRRPAIRPCAIRPRLAIRRRSAIRPWAVIPRLAIRP